MIVVVIAIIVVILPNAGAGARRSRSGVVLGRREYSARGSLRSNIYMTLLHMI